MDTIDKYKEYSGKPALELTSVLNKEGRKYRIERPGQAQTAEIIHTRVRIKVDKDLNITGLLTG